MYKGLLGLLGAFIGMALVLAACSSSTTTPGTSGSGSTGALSTSAASSSSSASGTPSATSQTNAVASPFASPSTSKTNQVTDLATAFKNLQSQDSYVMTAKLSNVEGKFASTPGVGDQSTLTIERSGEDQHLTVASSDGKTIFELWHVKGDVWVNIGRGPVKVATDNTMVSQFVAMLGADQQIMNAMESNDAHYTVAGTDTVDGTQATVENAEFKMSHSGGNIFFTNDENAAVTSKIWVAQDGNYLLKGQFSVSGGAGATPAAGASSVGTPSAHGSAQVTVNVTRVGQVQSIQPPS